MKRLIAILIALTFALLFSTTAFPQAIAEAQEKAKAVSLEYLRQQAMRRSASNEDFTVQRVVVDELSMRHTRVQQTYNGVPVFGGEAIVHLEADASVAAVTDALAHNIYVNTQPSLEAKEAIQAALKLEGCDDCLTEKPTADLWVLPWEKSYRLVWRVQMQRDKDQPSRPVYFIDAHTGLKVWSYDNLHTGTGASLYRGTVPIPTHFYGGMYYLQDLTRKLGVFNLTNTTRTFTPFTDANDFWDSFDQRAGVEVQYNLTKTFDYFQQIHRWSGMDGSGGPGTYWAAGGTTKLLTAGVHYGAGVNNAFWDPASLTLRFGDGDGSRFSPLVSLDYVAHEWMHGITQFTANLTYANESGALSESLSDVFGAMVERSVDGENADVWKIGEDCYTPNFPGDASRYLNEPHLADGYGYTTDDQPDHYSERYLGTGDYGGVHVNSGIANKAFYLVAKGGTHHRGGSMTGIGADAAAAIWFRALRYYLTSSTDFLAAREATLQAAADLYPNNGNVYFAVAKAWGLCGVGEVPTLIVSPVKLRLPLVAGCANTWQKELSITSASGSPTTWTATDNAAWLTLNRTSGTTPMSLTVTVNTAGLPFQSHSATITLTANGKAVRVPVSLFPSRMACQTPAS